MDNLVKESIENFRISLASYRVMKEKGMKYSDVNLFKACNEVLDTSQLFDIDSIEYRELIYWYCEGMKELGLID